MNEPKLSVIIPTYNHENYIEECIRSVLMQRVDFEYEVLIGEDCSPDGTREVLKRLEKELPDYFHIYYRETNMGIWKNNNADDLRDKAQGKYLITIEGDDFLVDPDKFQRQVDFLDNNPDYIAVCHKCLPVDKDSKPYPEGFRAYPECEHEEYSFKDYEKIIFAGHTATRMYRREYEGYRHDFEQYRLYEKWPGDNLHPFLQLMYGKVKCLDGKWSAYRYITSGGNNYCSNYKYDDETVINSAMFYKSLYVYAKAKHNKKATVTAGKLYYWKYMEASFGHRHLFSRKKAIANLCKEKYAFVYIVFMVKREITLRLKKISKK